MVVGFASLPINPDLIQYNETAYKKLITNELQGSRNEGVNAGIVDQLECDSKDQQDQAVKDARPVQKAARKKVRFEEDHHKWNSSKVKYQVNYPIDKFMQDYEQKEQVAKREFIKKSLSDKLQKKFSMVNESLD